MNTERPKHARLSITRGVKPSELAVGVKKLLQVGGEPWVRIVRAETPGRILKHAEYNLPVAALLVGWRCVSSGEAARIIAARIM